ncbi:hypothetical protein DM02DRAFT_547108 [Periconia macrospinosa]|uniref:Uncharacterized protein n=1 Tax=Periconia macrospinosa TaxID=97972 RepID=A0A2V1CYI2_9PLEO|nr:hypothetical protein DM02DRAFT_547108 [Periconia macrospinosa]
MEDEEERRLANEVQVNSSLPVELDHDEDTPWLRECGWARWFACRPLHVIAATSQLPSPKHEDLYLGSWNGTEWTSFSSAERKLLKLVEFATCALNRCEETLSSTSRVLRCWLRSWGPHYCPIPFEMPKRQATRKKYRSYCYRFLCYVFRARQVCLAQGQDVYDMYGVRLTAPQAKIADLIWEELAKFLPNKAERDLSDPLLPLLPPSPYILETTFQLLTLFWTDTSVDDESGVKAIAHFSGVLGIHPYKLTLRTAYDYTPYLSALIWVGRLVLLEYALPLRAYGSLNPPLQARAAYPDQESRLLREIRPKYLKRGTFAPLGYLVERLQHGRAIAKREGTRTNISWSPDGQMLEVNGSYITLGELRHTVYSLLGKINQETHELMFHWWPDVNLHKIKDDLVSYRSGYSFLEEPENNLRMTLDYLRRRDYFVRLLFAGIHVTIGMPARGEEIRIIRWANTIAVQRNVIVHKGRMMLLFSYNKVATTANHSFYIVRVPCPTVERALFLYLAYIRPFSDFLARQLKLTHVRAKTNPHLFAFSNQPTVCFSAADCSKSLEQATADCPIRLQLSIYRHIAVAISKKHIPTLLEPFDPNIPKDHDGFLHLLAFQTGHTPSIHASAYALERGYPARLQPELIDRYYEASFIWHRFLEITTERPIGKGLDRGQLDCQVLEAQLATTTPAGPVLDDSASEKDPFVLSSEDEEIAEVDWLEERQLRSGKRSLNGDSRILRREPSISLSSRRNNSDRSDSPTTTRIVHIQKQLDDLLQERAAKRQKRCH